MQKWGKGVKNETCINFQQILYDIYNEEVSMSILQSSTNGQSWLKWNKFGWYVNAVLFWTRRHANQSYYSLNKFYNIVNEIFSKLIWQICRWNIEWINNMDNNFKIRIGWINAISERISSIQTTNFSLYYFLNISPNFLF